METTTTPAARAINDARRHAGRTSVRDAGRTQLWAAIDAERFARVNGGRAYWGAYAAESLRLDPTQGITRPNPQRPR